MGTKNWFLIIQQFLKNSFRKLYSLLILIKIVLFIYIELKYHLSDAKIYFSFKFKK